jgi:putative two-component system response regulator
MVQPSVLIIEDDPSLRALEARLAGAAGFSVHTAEDGAQGIAAAVQLSPNLIVTDYHMPGMKAPEILATLRRLPGLDGVPVLVATAEPLELVGAELRRLGAHDIITKPFSPAAFKQQLRDCLGLDRPVAPPPAPVVAAPAPSPLLMVLAAAMELPGSSDSDAALRHVRRVGLVSAMIADKLFLDTDLLAILTAYAPLHDVGKVSLPARLVRGGHRFSDGDRAEMESHTLLGAELLRRGGAPLLGQQIALHHHERWDGAGYPRGLQGEAIPLLARIVAAADVYDAMRSHRSYRPDLPPADVRRRVAGLRGNHLDPRIVDVLLAEGGVLDVIYAEHGDPSTELDLEVWR